MVNSIRIAADIIAKLPKDVSPEATEKYEPFIHPYEVSGSVENAEIKMLLRSFKLDELAEFKAQVENIAKDVQADFPNSKIDIEVKHQYKNMYEYVKDKPIVLETLWNAVKETGAEPEWEPIRGGTDGSRLSEKGLPTPNIFAGCNNAHSTREYVSVNAMMKAVETIINIAKNLC